MTKIKKVSGKIKSKEAKASKTEISSSEKEPSKILMRPLLKEIRILESQYNNEVNMLLEKIDDADLNGDTETLKQARVTAEAHRKTFSDLKRELNSQQSDDPASAEVANQFMDNQIAFFNVLSEELDKRLGEDRYTALRKTLE